MAVYMRSLVSEVYAPSWRVRLHRLGIDDVTGSFGCSPRSKFVMVTRKLRGAGNSMFQRPQRAREYQCIIKRRREQLRRCMTHRQDDWRVHVLTRRPSRDFSQIQFRPDHQVFENFTPTYRIKNNNLRPTRDA
jgi:hypothetical protein